MLLYINDILSALDLESIRESVLGTISEFRVHPEPKPAYTEFIIHRKPQESEGMDISSFWSTRLKLVELLQSSLNYDAAAALERIEAGKDLLLAELVILYGRVMNPSDLLTCSSFDMRRLSNCLFMI